MLVLAHCCMRVMHLVSGLCMDRNQGERLGSTDVK